MENLWSVGDRIMIPGVVAQQVIGSGGGGGSSSAMVHFAGSKQGDGTTYLSCPSLSCVDNGLFAFSFWTDGLCAVANNNSIIWVVDPDGDYLIEAQTFTHSAVDGCLFFEYGTDASPSDISFSPLTAGRHHVMGSSDTQQSSGDQIMSLYLDDVLQTGLGIDFGGSAVSGTINGKKFVFGDDTFGNGPTCIFKDVWIAPGVKLHQSDGTILTTDRRKFITAGLEPADPSGFPSSAILFTGNRSSFPINRGTGGHFTLTGTLTDA